jgi:hypothetical protein
MIGNDWFGYEVDSEEFINKLLTTLPVLNSIDSKIMLCDLYEHQYGIYPHLNNGMKSPLSSVIMTEGEDYTTGSLMEEAIRTYVSRGIKDIYGLSIVEFLELPIDVIDVLVQIAGEDQSRKSDILNDIQKDMKMK